MIELIGLLIPLAIVAYLFILLRIRKYREISWEKVKIANEEAEAKRELERKEKNMADYYAFMRRVREKYSFTYRDANSESRIKEEYE